MAPFCPVIKKRKYGVTQCSNKTTVTSINIEEPFHKEKNQPTLWEIKKQILFLQDMVATKNEAYPS